MSKKIELPVNDIFLVDTKDTRAVKSELEKTEIISYHFSKIMETLGLDLTDSSLSGTPDRVAKMFVNELFVGIDPLKKPKLTLFPNKYNDGEMIIKKNISIYSYCEHHFVPFFGKAYIAYIPQGKIIGLSKLSRIVQYYSKRPQVQERLTNDIATELKQHIQIDDVAVLIEAKHLCVASRGIRDVNSTTITTSFSGQFKNDQHRIEFLNLIKS
ncbi:MAG: GTP cyclohydrolase I FolE [Phycisphaerales bacterium]|nr:GTP cyclohydrolase I FolE [Phycisphaerales bacterium]